MRIGGWLALSLFIGMGAVASMARSAGLHLRAGAAPVWLATATAVERRDIVTGETLSRFDLPAATRLAATADGGVWARNADTVACLSPARPAPTMIAIDATAADNVLLAADPADGSAWVTTGRDTLAHFDCDGRLQGVHRLPARFSVIAVALDHAVWLANSGAVLRVASTSSSLLALPPEPTASAAASIAVDSLTDRVWVLRGQTVTVLAFDGGTARLESFVTDASVGGAALDPRTGNLWLLTAAGIRVRAGDFSPVAAPALEAADVAGASALHYDGERDGFVASGGGVLRLFSRDGHALAMAAVEPDDPVVATLAFDVRPQLTLLQPPGDARTAVRQPPFLLQVEPLCNGVPCAGLPGYLEGITLSSELDDAAIVEPLRFDAATGRLMYVPASPLADGEHRYVAAARDRFGRASNTIAAQLVVADDDRAAVLAKAGNKAPTVSLVAPANNATFASGADIALAATAADADGSVTRVEFFRGGTTLLGTAPTPPYAYTWKSVPAGSYALTARATDNRNGTRTSAVVNITVVATPNVAPVVALTAPAASSVFGTGAAVALAADARDADGRVAKVEFLAGSMLVGTATAPPYGATWVPTRAGSYALTARATDDRGAATVSAPVQVSVIANAPPVVTLAAPVAGAAFVAPATVNLAATASDPDGSIAKVEFFRGPPGSIPSTLVATVTAPPYAAAWTDAAGGSYALQARATDNLGAVASSAIAGITIDRPPTATLSAPPDNASYVAGSMVSITFDAFDGDGRIARMDLYKDGTLFATITPTSTGGAYRFIVNWTNAIAGSYVFTGKAVDDQGAETTSAPIRINVNTAAVVTWLTPADGTSFAVGAPIDLAVVASTRVGTVARVDFYDGNTLIGSAAAPPHAMTWRGAAAGAHTISVRVVDNLGSATSSTGIGISVDAFALNIVAPTERESVFDPTVIVTGTFAGGAPAGIAVNGVAAVLGNGTFAAVVPMGADETTITAVASGVAGGSASRTVHVARQALGVVYRNVVDGQAINDDNVTIRGFATMPVNAAVAINGQRAAMDAFGNFFVNAVPLASGDNTLAVVLNGPDGKSLAQNLRIRSDAVAPFRLDVSPDSGMTAPHTAVLTLRNPGLLPYRKLDIGLGGSATPLFSEPGPAVPQGEHTATLVFANPGMYTLVITLWGEGSTILYRVQRAVHVGRPEELAARLRGIYTGMLDRLRVGQVDAAADAIASTVREPYREAFLQLGPALLPAVDSLGRISAAELAEDHATLTITRQKPDGVYAYPILFIRDSDGVWRIDGM